MLVLSVPDDPYLHMLDALQGRARVVIGDRPESYVSGAPAARALLNWTGKRALIEQVFGMAPHLEWIHSRYAGLNSILFPDLVSSPVTLTNARGVYSPSLGDFVILGMLFFAKDLRRLLRSQAASKWDPFTVTELRSRLSESLAMAISGVPRRSAPEPWACEF